MITYSPRVRVTLRRAANAFKPEDISSDVVEVETHKAYGQPTGSFSLVTTFAQRTNGLRYDQIVKPNDILLIEMDAGDGNGPIPVMLGLASEIDRMRTTDNEGRPVRNVQIAGEDFGKLLVKHHCMWPMAIRPNNIGSQVELTYGITLEKGGTPAQMAKIIVEKELFLQMPWTKQFVLLDRLSDIDDWWLGNITFSTQDTVWAVLEHVSDAPFNMLSADTGSDGLFHIILEVCPFSVTDGKLQIPLNRMHTVAINDVIMEKLGVNDHDRVNYVFNKVQCGIQGESGGNELLFIRGDAVQYDETLQSLQANGFLPWFPQSNFVPFATKVAPQISNTGALAAAPVKERTLALWNWHKDNATLESGLISLHISPTVRAGDGIIYEDNNYEYFVEQVGHKFDIANHSFQTSLHLTRGQKHVA